MKLRTTNNRSRKGTRRRKGFTLISIMAVGFFAIAMMMSLFPLILQSSNSETSLRNSTELRNAAEVAIDYGVVLLNQGITNKQATPLDLALNEYMKDYKPLDPLFADYPGISVSLRIKKLQPAEWADVKSFSSVYSSLLNPTEGNTLVAKDYWRVLEATATKGSLTRSIRVILEPRYDLPPSKPQNYPNPSSYFSNPFLASKKLILATELADGPLTIEPVQSTGNAELKYLEKDDITSNTTLLRTDVTVTEPDKPVQIAPVPTDITASNLSLSDLATNGQNLSSGSYKTANLDTSTLTHPVPVDTTSGDPVKIYIQDGNLAGNEIKINSSMLTQPAGSEAGNFQIFYEGTRNISINLSNNDFSAVVYAPNAQINLTGSGTMKGALVGSTINLSHAGSFKIDKGLDQATYAQTFDLVYETNQGSTEPTLQGYRTVSWKETTKRLAPLIN
jgi:hypothetical protein